LKYSSVQFTPSGYKHFAAVFTALCLIRESALNHSTCLCDSKLNNQQFGDREELCFMTLMVAKFMQRRLWLNGICLWSFGAMTRTENSEKAFCQFCTFITKSGLQGVHLHSFTLSAFKSEINPNCLYRLSYTVLCRCGCFVRNKLCKQNAECLEPNLSKMY